jgi:hypothetical protein
MKRPRAEPVLLAVSVAWLVVVLSGWFLIMWGVP